jgi:predicted ferric reductase
MYLSDLLSIRLMSLAMYLATRPTWLETPLGGMDRVYRTHKWAGILGGCFAIVHWLVGYRRKIPTACSIACRTWPRISAKVVSTSYEGAHPFTIANADQGDRVIEFRFKALGDYTRRLSSSLQAGQSVQIEGQRLTADALRGRVSGLLNQRWA